MIKNIKYAYYFTKWDKKLREKEHYISVGEFNKAEECQREMDYYGQKIRKILYGKKMGA